MLNTVHAKRYDIRYKSTRGAHRQIFLFLFIFDNFFRSGAVVNFVKLSSFEFENEHAYREKNDDPYDGRDETVVDIRFGD